MAKNQLDKSQARIYLENVEWMRKEIERLTVQNKEYDDRKINIRGIDYAKDRVQTSPDGDPMKMVDWYNDQIDENNALIFEYDRECKRAKSYIDRLNNDKYADLLYYHYIRLYDLKHVADMMGKSYPWTRSLKGKALVAFQTEVVDKMNEAGTPLMIHKPTA